MNGEIDRICLVGFYGISTVVGYLMPNPPYTYILNIYNFGLFGSYCISIIVGYLNLNPLYTYVVHSISFKTFLYSHLKLS